VRDVLMLVCDGLKGLPDSVNTVWDRTIVQTCVVHYADLRVMPMWLLDRLQDRDFALARSA
jgi:transposase-like protein